MVKPPWSMRQNPELAEQFFVLREGIPDGLMNSLISVLDEYYTNFGHHANRERTEHLARIIGRDLPYERVTLLETFSDDHELLLDALDHLLTVSIKDANYKHRVAHKVKQYFSDARSIYDIRHVAGDEYEIQHRQPPELTSLVENTVNANTRASEHLRRAWSHAFSRDRSPNEACFEATKAIEAVAGSIILPNNPKPTLGKMVSAMEDKASNWTTDFESAEIHDVDTVIAMMKMVWKGHLRHGNPSEPLDVSPERADMIMHLAVLLVHWFSSGRIRASR